MLGYDVIDHNELPLTGFCADSDHHEVQQGTQGGTVCAEPGSHIILSTPGAKQRGCTGAEAVQLLEMSRGEPGTVRPPLREQKRKVPERAAGHCRSPNNLLIPERYSHPRVKSAYKRAPPWSRRGGEVIGGVRRRQRLRRKSLHLFPSSCRCATCPRALPRWTSSHS